MLTGGSSSGSAGGHSWSRRRWHHQMTPFRDRPTAARIHAIAVAMPAVSRLIVKAPRRSGQNRVGADGLELRSAGRNRDRLRHEEVALDVEQLQAPVLVLDQGRAVLDPVAVVAVE